MSVKQPKTIVKQHFWGSQIAFQFYIKHVLLAPQGALVVIAFLITPMAVHFLASGSVSTFPIYVVFLVMNFFLFNFFFW